MSQEKIQVRNSADMDRAALNFLSKLNSSAVTPAQAWITGLSGELGAGKTTFVQAVARALGIAETVTSPTFVIEKIYAIPPSKEGAPPSIFKHLIHIDAYRLESPGELARLGFNEIAADPANLILIEWPERVAELLPPDFKKISFAHIDESTRELIFDL
jgi:tRNA threonylcarbamoyladenosine biosynthesis protein TsaE